MRAAAGMGERSHLLGGRAGGANGARPLATEEREATRCGGGSRLRQERLELVDHKLRRPTIAPPPPYLREIPLMTSTCYYDRMRTTQIKTQLRADVDVASIFFFAPASARASDASARPRDRVRGPFEPVDFPTE